MQTIARANRVFGEKVNGLIVDYIGVFRDLQRALAIYGSASGGGVEEGDTPVQSKAALVDELRNAIAETLQFCTERGINFDQIQNTTQAFARTKLWNDAVEAILVNDDSKQRYLALLVEFAQELKVENKRAIAENLEEEELAIVDLLTKPDITLTEKEKLDVKKVAKELLSTLKQEKLVLNWRRRQKTKADVKVTIEKILDQLSTLR